MPTIRNGFMLAIMLVLFAGSAWAAPRFTPVQGDVVKKVDAYDYFVDYSGTMMMNQPQLKAEKVTAAKKVLEDLNSLLPALDYQAGLYTFAPYGALVRNAKWDRGAMAKGIGQISADKDVFGRMTNMGDGFLDHAAAISAMKGRKALIIASDGENNKGSDPVGEARKLLQANPDLCLHIISVADSAEGQATLDAIARLKGCTVMAKAGDLLADDAAMRKFAEGVFYDKKMDDVIVLRGVNFAFNSDNLDHRAQGILNEVAAAIKAKPSARVLLNGYTDHFGTDKYNLGLSQRRADSVKAYLVRQGIPASRMTTHGKGKSFTYDNKTEEGCYLNRRVEFVFAE